VKDRKGITHEGNGRTGEEETEIKFSLLSITLHMLKTHQRISRQSFINDVCRDSNWRHKRNEQNELSIKLVAYTVVRK